MAAEPLLIGNLARTRAHQWQWQRPDDFQDVHFAGEILGNLLVTWRSDQQHHNVYAHVPLCYICKASSGPWILQTRHLLNIDGVNSLPPSNIRVIYLRMAKSLWHGKSLWFGLFLSSQYQSSQCLFVLALSQIYCKNLVGRFNPL